MTKCEEQVAIAMAGATLTPEERRTVDELCVAYPAYLVVHQLKFDRARKELLLLFGSAGFSNDQNLWELANALLAILMDPKAALEQAKSELDQSSATKASLDIKGVLAKAQKMRKDAQAQNPDGSRLGGGPK